MKAALFFTSTSSSPYLTALKYHPNRKWQSQHYHMWHVATHHGCSLLWVLAAAASRDGLRGFACSDMMAVMGLHPSLPPFGNLALRTERSPTLTLLLQHMAPCK